MANTPAFQYYPADLMSDPEVMFWDMEAMGCYWQMITYLWLNGGKFEYNIENLCKLFRKNHKKTAEKYWKKIEKKFELKDGVVTHKRVLKEMQKQAESRLRRQEAGRRGGLQKAENCSNATENTVAKLSPSSLPSSSTSVIRKKKLMPIIGKNCHCGLPAVYIKGGAYDNYYCIDHAPLKVRELYC